MKNLFLALIVISSLSCSNTKALSASSFENYAKGEQLTDTFINDLRQKNEVVLAFAIENNAWARTISYQVIAMHNNQWAGYTYTVNKTGSYTASPVQVDVFLDTCNAVWKFIQEKEAWKIEGDKGKDFCKDSQNSNCNINDGVIWHIFIIAKDKVIHASYYEPQFYEDCCPGNTERQLFIESADKIKNAAAGAGSFLSK